MMNIDMKTLPLVLCCRPLGSPTLSEGEIEAAATLFKALADPARVRILNQVATAAGPVCACDFESPLGLKQATVSHHLKKLTEAGLLEREQRGKWAFFSINREAVGRLAELLEVDE
jgi:ArsR family transcriptional regulator, arsenate/arsenite/antimonite-responsive transcriptional repressor